MTWVTLALLFICFASICCSITLNDLFQQALKSNWRYKVKIAERAAIQAARNYNHSKEVKSSVRPAEVHTFNVHLLSAADNSRLKKGGGPTLPLQNSSGNAQYAADLQLKQSKPADFFFENKAAILPVGSGSANLSHHGTIADPSRQGNDVGRRLPDSKDLHQYPWSYVSKRTNESVSMAMKNGRHTATSRTSIPDTEDPLALGEDVGDHVAIEDNEHSEASASPDRRYPGSVDDSQLRLLKAKDFRALRNEAYRFLQGDKRHEGIGLKSPTANFAIRCICEQSPCSCAKTYDAPAVEQNSQLVTEQHLNTITSLIIPAVSLPPPSSQLQQPTVCVTAPQVTEEHITTPDMLGVRAAQESSEVQIPAYSHLVYDLPTETIVLPHGTSAAPEPSLKPPLASTSSCVTSQSGACLMHNQQTNGKEQNSNESSTKLPFQMPNQADILSPPKQNESLKDAALPMPDLHSLLSKANIKDRILSLQDCYFRVSDDVCGLKFNVLPNFCNGKVSFSVLMNKLMPNYDLASVTDDLITYGKFDCTYFILDRCTGDLAINLVSRELLDIIPNKIRLLQATVSLNMSYYGPTKQSLSGIYLAIQGHLKIRGTQVDVFAVKERGTVVYNLTMAAMALEIPDFVKLFADFDNQFNNLPSDLTLLLSSTLRQPRVSGLYGSGAFEFVASAESYSSVFPSRPKLYIIVQKPRLGRVVAGLIATFRNTTLKPFLTSLFSRDFGKIPLISDLQTNLVLGVASEGLYVVKDELFNKEVSSVISPLATIKRGLTIKGILPIKKMISTSDTSGAISPDNALVSLKVVDGNLTVEFLEGTKLNVLALSKLFHVKGQDVFPTNADFINMILLNMRKYVVDLASGTLLLSCSAPDPVAVGTSLKLSDVAATLARNELSKWSFSLNGGYRLGNFSVDVNIQANSSAGYSISSVPASVRFSWLLNVIDKKKELQRELDLLRLDDFVIDNFQILGSLGTGSILRFLGKLTIAGDNSVALETIASVTGSELALDLLFSDATFDLVFGAVFGKNVKQRGWMNGLEIGLIVSPNQPSGKLSFQTSLLSTGTISEGIHVLMKLPVNLYCQGDGFCELLSSNVRSGFNAPPMLTGSFRKGSLELSSSVPWNVKLHASLSVRDAELHFVVTDVVNAFITGSCTVPAVPVIFSVNLSSDESGQLVVAMAGDGDWSNPFRLSNVVLGNLTVKTVVASAFQRAQSLSIKARIRLGVSGASAPLSAEALIALDLTGKGRSAFTAQIKDFTFMRLATAFGAKRPVPRFLAHANCGDDVSASFDESGKGAVTQWWQQLELMRNKVSATASPSLFASSVDSSFASHPSASFTIDTPFGFMTSAEFKEYVTSNKSVASPSLFASSVDSSFASHPSASFTIDTPFGFMASPEFKEYVTSNKSVASPSLSANSSFASSPSASYNNNKLLDLMTSAEFNNNASSSNSSAPPSLSAPSSYSSFVTKLANNYSRAVFHNSNRFRLMSKEEYKAILFPNKSSAPPSLSAPSSTEASVASSPSASFKISRPFVMMNSSEFPKYVNNSATSSVLRKAKSLLSNNHTSILARAGVGDHVRARRSPFTTTGSTGVSGSGVAPSLMLNGVCRILGIRAEIFYRFDPGKKQWILLATLPKVSVGSDLLVITGANPSSQSLSEGLVDQGEPSGASGLMEAQLGAARSGVLLHSVISDAGYQSSFLGLVSLLGFSAFGNLVIRDEDLAISIEGEVAGYFRSQVSLQAAYEDKIEDVKFNVSGCLSVQASVKKALIDVFKKAAVDTRKTLVSTQDRVQATEKIFDAAHNVIVQQKSKAQNLRNDIRKLVTQVRELSDGVTRNCVSECGTACFGVPSWRRSTLTLPGSYSIGAPTWDKCYDRLPDLGCVTRCLGRKVIQNVRANSRQLELQTLMGSLADVKRRYEESKVVLVRARSLVDATLNGLENVNRKIKTGIEISRFLSQKNAEDLLQIERVCFSDTLERASKTSVLFRVELSLAGQRANISIKVALDRELVRGLARGLAQSIYAGLKDFGKQREAVKVLLNNLDGEKKDILKALSKVPDEGLSDPEKREVTWTPEENDYRRLAYGELPRLTLGDDQINEIFETRSMWRMAPMNDPMMPDVDLQKIEHAHSKFAIASQDQKPCGRVLSSIQRYSDIIDPLSGFVEKFLQEKVSFYQQKNRRLADLRMIDDQIKSDCFVDNCTLDDMQSALSYLSKARTGTLVWADEVSRQIERQNKAGLGFFIGKLDHVLRAETSASLRSYIEHIQGNATNALKRTFVAAPVRSTAETNFDLISKELRSILGNESNSSTLSVIAPRVFKLKQRLHGLRRTSIPCGSKDESEEEYLSKKQNVDEVIRRQSDGESDRMVRYPSRLDEGVAIPGVISSKPRMVVGDKKSNLWSPENVVSFNRKISPGRKRPSKNPSPLGTRTTVTSYEPYYRNQRATGTLLQPPTWYGPWG